MKQYQLLQRDNQPPKLVSVNSLDYSDYLAAGYEIVASGNKKELQNQLEEMISELADCD